METAKAPVCLSMKRYRKRKKYQRLKRIISTSHEVNENETISMLEEYGQRGLKKKVKSIPKVSPKIAFPVESLRKWKDAYVEMMLCFARHVTQLNNGNVLLV